MVTLGNVGNEVCCGIATEWSDLLALASELNISPNNIITVNQVHGTAVLCLGGDSTDHHPGPPRTADVIVTNRSNVFLVVKVADCCGIVLYDSEQSVVGIVHSGWRGTAQGVTSAAITSMQHEFRTDPQMLRAWLSPCARRERYQVGRDVQAVLGRFCRPDPDQSDRWFFDNEQALVTELQSFGMPSGQILSSNECTIQDERYHSYRRQGSQAGRNFVFVCMLSSSN